MPDLLVGCPVRDRAWILDRWFDHVEVACEAAGVVPGYLFLAPRDDLDTLEVLRRRGRDATIELGEEGDEPPDPDDWAHRFRQMVDHYGPMVQLRNTLLEAVRRLAPPLFWSLDSDILVAERTLSLALELVGKYDAVGTKLYMTEIGTSAPSYGALGPQGLLRADAIGEFPVEIIMASKLMTPAAYAVDYAPHQCGEDVGWSLACRRAGVRLGWDGRACSKHVMFQGYLHRTDDRVGW